MRRSAWIEPSRTWRPSTSDRGALDLPLIAGGAKQGTSGQRFASYQTDPRLDDVTPIDFWPEPNFEQLAAQDPDLIIDDTPFDEDWQPLLETCSITAPPRAMSTPP